LDHVGVLTRTATDATYALGALTTATTPELSARPRLGIVKNAEYLQLSPEVRSAWTTVVEKLDTVDVQLPDWSTSFSTAANLQGPEAVANHKDRIQDSYQPDVRQRLLEAALVQPADYERAEEQAVAITAELDAVLATVDAVITPTVLTTAPPLTTPDADVRLQLLNNTRLANLTRHAAVSLPIPADGLPVGLQIIAASNEQAAAVACWIEAQR
ncbi:MAG TPA: amidase family protein, partial [Kribbella sp.]